MPLTPQLAAFPVPVEVALVTIVGSILLGVAKTLWGVTYGAEVERRKQAEAALEKYEKSAPDIIAEIKLLQREIDLLHRHGWGPAPTPSAPGKARSGPRRRPSRRRTLAHRPPPSRSS